MVLIKLSEGKKKIDEANTLIRASKVNSHCRVVQKSAQIEDGYSQYLCFNIIIGSNNLLPEVEYTDHQQRNHDLIKSLHDGGMGYRKIAQYLNERDIKNARGNSWNNTQVFSVLKRYRQRQNREEVRETPSDIEFGRMELVWIK